MLKVCITGSIGSGKTTVSNIFSKLGISVFKADDEAKKFFNHTEVKEKILTAIGNSVFSSDGEIDKKAMASKIFNNADALKTINSIIHPLVMKKFNKWADEKIQSDYVILESAIIYESSLTHYFNKIISVSAPKDLRLRRVIKRDLVGHEEVYQRMRNQWSDEEKSKKADYIINNDGRQLIIPQIIKIHKDLCL